MGILCPGKILVEDETMHTKLNAKRGEGDVMRRVQSHQNIVKLIYVTKRSIVMEKCMGGDLFDAVQENRFDLVVLKKVFRQILVGIEYIHGKGYAHLDIKLDNIMLMDKSKDNPVVKIIDFGCSMECCSEQLQGCFLCGTYGYIPPEIIQGVFSQKSDMWSFGVVVFIMLYKFNPFNPSANRSSSDILQAVMRGFQGISKPAFGAFFPESISQPVEARDFIVHLLCDVNCRLSAKEALDHPFLVA